MEKNRLDAIASVIMEPDMRAQEDLRLRRESEAKRLALQRRYASFGLSGFLIGAAVGHIIFGRISYFGLIGGFLGVLVGRLSTRTSA